MARSLGKASNPRKETSPAVARVRFIRDILLVALGAALYTLAFAPFEWASLGWIALTPLFVAIRGRGFAQAALYGMLFGVAICAGAAYWMYFAISNYFVATFPLNLALTLAAYTLFVGVYTGAAAAASSLLINYGGQAIRWAAVPALWVVSEYARSTLLSGFSWGLLGYTQYRHLAIIQITDLSGVYGVSFLLACSSYATAELIFASGNRWRDAGGAIASPALAYVAVTIVAAFVYGEVRLRYYGSNPAKDSIRVAIVTRKTEAQDRFERIRYLRAFVDYAKATADGVARGSTDLIIWPEFASGFYLDSDRAMRMQLNRLTAATDAALLAGAPRSTQSDGSTHYYNSAYLFSPSGELLDTYDKIRLLPFAEYRPFGMQSLTSRSSDYPEEFTAGSRSTVFSIPRARFGVMICFEATYPNYARRLARNGAQFLVNISNDVWLSSFSGTSATSQHFAMAVMRAVENKRALARVTAAGITGLVDPVGGTHRLSESEGVKLLAIPLNDEVTIYTRFGDWFVVVCLLFSIFSLTWIMIARHRNDADA
jgi:apolipoprotein N-acyltransferase